MALVVLGILGVLAVLEVASLGILRRAAPLGTLLVVGVLVSFRILGALGVERARYNCEWWLVEAKTHKTLWAVVSCNDQDVLVQ